MQGYAEESPLISSPRGCEDGFSQVEERSIDPRAVRQVHPHITQLLRNKKAMSSIVCMDHGHRVTESIGNFL